MGSGDAEVDHHLGHRFRGHRTASISVDRVRDDEVTGHRLGEEIFRHDRVLGVGDEPPGDIAGEDIQHDVEFVPSSFLWSFQRGDVPAPHLAGAVGDQLGTNPGWVGGLGPSFPALSGVAGDAVHARLRAPVAALVELAGPHLWNRQVTVGLGVQQRQDPGSFVVGDRRGRQPPWQPGSVYRSQRCRPARVSPPVVGGPGPSGQRARHDNRHLRGPQLGERGVQDVFGGVGGCWSSALSDSCSTSACAFPMMSNAVRVFFNSASSFAFRARSRSSSAASTDLFGRFSDRRESATPSSAPASRARVHSITCDEYKPSRRRIAPFSPFGAFSYSVTIASLYSGLNERRDGRGDGPSADRGPDGEDDPSPPPPPVAPRRSSVDTNTRISDHAPYCEPLAPSCLTRS